MSLSAWEQDALDSIGNGLAGSDPALAARLAMFTRLASGEAMPMREKLKAVSRRMARRRPARRPPAGAPAGYISAWACSGPCCWCGWSPPPH